MTQTTTPLDPSETLAMIERDYRDAPELIRENMLERINDLKTLTHNSLAVGSEVSMDVSTGDDDATRRVFGVLESIKPNASEAGHIGLCAFTDDNFKLLGHEHDLWHFDDQPPTTDWYWVAFFDPANPEDQVSSFAFFDVDLGTWTFNDLFDEDGYQVYAWAYPPGPPPFRKGSFHT